MSQINFEVCVYTQEIIDQATKTYSCGHSHSELATVYYDLHVFNPMDHHKNIPHLVCPSLGVDQLVWQARAEDLCQSSDWMFYYCSKRERHILPKNSLKLKIYLPADSTTKERIALIFDQLNTFEMKLGKNLVFIKNKFILNSGQMNLSEIKKLENVLFNKYSELSFKYMIEQKFYIKLFQSIPELFGIYSNRTV